MKEWLYRALRTFVQAVLGYIVANVAVTLSGLDLSDAPAIKAAIIGLVTAALAAGIAAVMNLAPPVVDGAAARHDTDNEYTTLPDNYEPPDNSEHIEAVTRPAVNYDTIDEPAGDGGGNE